MLTNNLGGVGPAPGNHGETIYYHSVFQMHGRDVDLMIREVGNAYKLRHQHGSLQVEASLYNGVMAGSQGVASIYIGLPGTYEFEYIFTFADSGEPAVFENLPMAFYNI